MPAVCLYFQLHQPYRLRRYSVFDTDRHYFDDFKNASLLRTIADRCYLPTNQLMLDLLSEHRGGFSLAYSISGILLEQMRAHTPEVIDSFKKLAATGRVEFLNETYHHSLAYLYSPQEFRHQVARHRDLINDLFDQSARVFRNTELIYNNDLATLVRDMGYSGVLAEGVDDLLGARTANAVYAPSHGAAPALLLRNYRLSDDIAFRFGDKGWAQHPLTAEKFAKRVGQIEGDGAVCNLFMDYETFGEHQWKETGIFEFLRHLPGRVLDLPKTTFLTPSQAIDTLPAAGTFDCPRITSWADTERDLSAWAGNAMQTNALTELHKLEPQLHARGDAGLLEDWRKLGTSDHFYYMSTKFWSDGEVHLYFSPYESPYDAYINFMNVLDNIKSRARN
jgi:alpha-amylase